MDIYDIKKQLHGEESALAFIYNLVNNRNPNNKHNWIEDHEIIDPLYGHPLKFISGNKSDDPLQIEVVIDNGKTIIDDGTYIDKIGNDIVSNNVLKAHNDQIYQAMRKADDCGVSGGNRKYYGQSLHL